MAATVTQQVLADGPRNLILKYTIAGTTGDTSAGTMVDASDFNDANGKSLGANGLALMSVQANLVDASYVGDGNDIKPLVMKLEWDADTNIELVFIGSNGGPMEQDFSMFGGIKDNGGSGSTGDVVFTTTNYTASGDGGHVVLKFRKT